MAEKITIFECGPSKCEHAYDRYEPIYDDSDMPCGETAVCSKCGTRAIDEAAWL